ncbi:MAG: ribulose-phosphate 3-epimerase, partial [Candidatus Latescibacterota bacterium]
MKVRIAPSLLAADLSCLGDEIARAEAGGCDMFHVDIMDFHFVPNLSFGPNVVAAVRRLTRLPIDVHLMVDNPLDMLKSFAEAGSSGITVHTEVLEDIPAVLETIAGYGIRKGLSFRPDTPVGTIIPYLGMVDIVLVMSVYPGFGGQRFIEESYARVSRISAASADIGVSPVISVDGGVDLSNAPLLAQAG